MDIWPHNFMERSFTIFVMVLGLTMFSSLVGKMTSAFEQLREMSTDEWQQFWLLRRYLKEQKISKDLTQRIQRYADYSYQRSRKRKQEGEVKLLKLLSEQLRDELL